MFEKILLYLVRNSMSISRNAMKLRFISKCVGFTPQGGNHHADRGVAVRAGCQDLIGPLSKGDPIEHLRKSLQKYRLPLVPPTSLALDDRMLGHLADG